jgi:hypothetical protein
MQLTSAGRRTGEGFWASGTADSTHQGSGEATDGARIISGAIISSCFVW